MMTAGYFRYWGKASVVEPGPVNHHLLAFHSLDVAACGEALVGLPAFALDELAVALGWPLATVEKLFVFFLALHDLGKFSRSFQGLATDLSADLVAPAGTPYDLRHDSLGWLFWRDVLAEGFPGRLAVPESDFWSVWMKTAAGHHGRPPRETTGGGLLELNARRYFLPEDRQGAVEFVEALASALLPEEIPLPGREQRVALKRHAWRLAGLAILADWLGSNQAHFAYRCAPMPLSDYWHDQAKPRARQALDAAGLQNAPLRRWARPIELFDYLVEPTPLQRYTAEVALQPGPQLFLLEDVTGAGKTEAALILAQRLMQAGRARGLYFALPSMATANQMYQRVGQVYRRLYQADSAPSLILAHGARELVDGFRDSLLQPGEQPADRSYSMAEGSATAQCNAWLADNRKKALLAEVGVGTLDQALLAVLPARHQSLRLLGLAGKVLLVDEVHAYDPYIMTLLKTLLSAHARQGGSVILLSATLPLKAREELLSAYRHGLGFDEDKILSDHRYPLATQAAGELISQACATRPQLRRHVRVNLLHSEEEVLAQLLDEARRGRCVCWIRNTVEDARRAFQALSSALPVSDVTLFHSRFAMADRLDIEDAVLARFGKRSGAAARRGKVLIGTQVLEQSLDFCIDVMFSDLAPIDLLIQRAGRLQRHARTAQGDPAVDGIERREPAVLHVLSPRPLEEPAGDWYSALFAKGCFVYPDAGRLWLGARALLRAGYIVSPGRAGQAGAVRELVEAVYGDSAEEEIPQRLRRATEKQMGEDYAMQSQAQFNQLHLERGYSEDSSARWYEDGRVPTRLGDESLTVYLAREVDGQLRPLREGGSHAWAQSAVRIDARRAKALAPEWEARFAGMLQVLRAGHRLLEEPAFILPFSEGPGGLMGKVMDSRDALLVMRYSTTEGLLWD
jgi:CRISPR-associated endonuclease/helicase Cas3